MYWLCPLWSTFKGLQEPTHGVYLSLVSRIFNASSISENEFPCIEIVVWKTSILWILLKPHTSVLNIHKYKCTSNCMTSIKWDKWAVYIYRLYMLHIRAVCYIYGLYVTYIYGPFVTYTGHMLHIRSVCYIYGSYVTYTGCILHIQAVCYIYGQHVTYTSGKLHKRAICYIYGLYVTYTDCMLHIRAVCYIYRVCMLHIRAIC
jgi:hypothetical protein